MSIAKNILFGVIGANNQKVSKIGYKLSSKHSKKNDGFGALNVMQYSFYAQKKGRNMYDTKTNFPSWLLFFMDQTDFNIYLISMLK